ncbi:MAG TPA: lasso peptide biosynthesis B2 protein [Gemmatimonadales bacterium]|nr:lasso peptide biosynthesis B2 protein [Gemmatimonadales bacterium]
MRALRILRRAARLTPREVRLLVEAQYTLLACQVARWQRPPGQLLKVANEPDASVSVPETNFSAAAEVEWALSRAAQYGAVRPACLVRSLALQRMLRRHGTHASELRLGFRMSNGNLEAHAWVELNDMVIGDSRAHVSTFTPATGRRLVEQ